MSSSERKIVSSEEASEVGSPHAHGTILWPGLLALSFDREEVMI